MPISASTPRIATKPIGAPEDSIAATTPMIPSGATAMTTNMVRKLCTCIMVSSRMTKIITGTAARIGSWLSALDSTVPPTATL